MSEIILNKIVIIGWNNFTASLVDGIKKTHSNCDILCIDCENGLQSTPNTSLLSHLPSQKAAIFEDADIVIIDKNYHDTCTVIKDIKSLLPYGTYVMDFQAIKTEPYERICLLLGEDNPYISCYAFLDDVPKEFTVRGDLFHDKIIAVISNNSTQILQYMRDFWNILNAKIVPTTAEFFDEIFAETTQSVTLLSHMLTHILQQDSWADTLFFGFYSKELRSFLSPINKNPQLFSEHIISNADNMRRILSLMKREINIIDQMIDNEEMFKLVQYLTESRNFKNRI